MVLREDAHFNLMRPGLAIYGLPPVAAVRDRVELRPVMTFKTRILQIKRVSAGSGVSYGHTFITPRESVIAVMAVGYADGYRRGMQQGGEVLIRGHRAPVVGRRMHGPDDGRRNRYSWRAASATKRFYGAALARR